MLQFMGSQRVGHDGVTELTEHILRMFRLEFSFKNYQSQLHLEYLYLFVKDNN